MSTADIPSIPAETYARDFYRRSMTLLEEAQLPFLVGGGYAMGAYTGIARQTKDLDLFVRPADRQRALDVLAAGGYKTEWTFPQFLGKAISGQAFVDVLFNSGNGLCPVDEEWFENAEEGQVLGRTVNLCPAEEILWSKAYVQERDRFDGADVAHLILSRADKLNWRRLLDRFKGSEGVLAAHLLLFGFIYPSERARVPQWVIDEAIRRANSAPATVERVCRGRVLSQSQYQIDIEKWGFVEGR